MKRGVVDAGGGLRGIYAAGVLDFCLDHQLYFDYGIGVSAGSANVASYLARQRGRNYRFYVQYTQRKEYMSAHNFLHNKSYINLDYAYGTLCAHDGEDPYDYEALCKNPAEFLVVAEEAVSGKVRYFTKNDIAQDDYRVMMASSSLPGVNQPYEIDGMLYYDGALADPIPIQKALDEGCDKVVVLLTRPTSVERTPGKDNLIACMIQKHYPKSADNLRKRAEHYNASVALAKRYEKEGKALVIAPEDTDGVTTLSHDPAHLDALYHRGYRDAERILAWW